MVSPLLSRAEIFSFDTILRARASALGPLSVSIDGGAGWGDTAKTIIESTADDGVVHAFEPFPGNHRFFNDCDSRIKLYKFAIADQEGSATFVVPQVVQASDAWADKGMSGYSSVGYLQGANQDPLWKRTARQLRDVVQTTSKPGMQSIDVKVTTVSKTVSAAHIDFVKLDLQGAELKALIGFGGLLDAVDMLWVEFSNQPGLFEFLRARGFLLFDTNYLCVGASADLLAAAGLEGRQNLTLSTSKDAVLARRLNEESDYLEWFARARKSAGVWQTDLLCVNPSFIPGFLKLLGQLS
jgi:FkbM family methyltransferase